MTRVMTVVGTRPEIIRLARVIDALDRTVDHTLVHTGTELGPGTVRRLLQPSRVSGARISSCGPTPSRSVTSCAAVLVGTERAITELRLDALLCSVTPTARFRR